MSVAIQPFFSKEFHTTASVVLSLYPRKGHILLDPQGTLTVVSFSAFTTWMKDLGRTFGITQNTDLIAVHKRLKYLEQEIQDPTSAVLGALKEEVHSGYMAKEITEYGLLVQLRLLNLRFQHGNEAAAEAGTLLKIINFIRSVFNFQPIEHYTYTPIDVKLFATQVICPAQKLTAQELLATHYQPTLQLVDPELEVSPTAANLISPSSGALQTDLEGAERTLLRAQREEIKQKLAAEKLKLQRTMQEVFPKLELGLMAPMPIATTPTTELMLAYDAAKKRFKLIYKPTEKATSPQDVAHSCIKVVETPLERYGTDTAETHHRLQCELKYVPSEWLSWRSAEYIPVDSVLELAPDHEYTIVKPNNSSWKITTPLRSTERDDLL